MGWMSAIVTLAGRRVGVKSLYNPGEDKKSVSWKSDELEIGCYRESQRPAEWSPDPRLSSPGEQERNTVMANKMGVNMLQFCLVSNSLSE